MNISRLGFTFVAVLATAAGAQTPAGAPASDTSRKSDTAVSLPQVTIAGKRVSYPVRYEAAYRRAASGRGYYVTRDEIEATNPRDLESLLQRVPTVEINSRGVTFAKCQAGMPSPGETSQAARVQVYVDGRRATMGGDDGVRQVLESIPVSSVQIMEIYTGQSRIPGEFFADACAAIVIWTRAY